MTRAKQIERTNELAKDLLECLRAFQYKREQAPAVANLWPALKHFQRLGNSSDQSSAARGGC